MVNVLSSSFVEIVHVELSDKRSEVIVLEIGRKDFLAELRRLFDDKSCAFRIPVNNIREFPFFEDIVGFANERRD